MTIRERDGALDDAFPKFVVGAVGPSETGKTRALWELFISQFPRRVSFDFEDEMRRKFNPDAIVVRDFTEFCAALRYVATGRTWHIALVYDPDDKPALAAQVARVLHPPRTSDDHSSFAIEQGGVMVDCCEADFIFPNGRTPSTVRGLAQRGRHNGIYLAVATQAPALIDTRLRDAIDPYLAFRTQEDVVWKFWQRVTSGRVADTISELPPYHCAYIVKSLQRVYLLDERRRVYRLLDYKGAELARDARLCGPHQPAPSDGERDALDGDGVSPHSGARRPAVAPFPPKGDHES